MTAQFSLDISVQEQFVDMLDAAAGVGVISCPIAGFLPGDQINSVALVVSGTGLATIQLAVDQVVRSYGYFVYSDSDAILAAFTLSAAQVAAIAAATNCKYAIQTSVTRGGKSYTREVQAGNVSTRPAAPAQPNVVNTIAITGGPAIAAINGTVQLTAVGYDGLGNIVSGATFVWTTSDASIATVSATGLVTIKSVGTATITATSYGVSATTSASAGATPFPVGAVVYASATNALGFAAIGTANQFLVVNGGGTAPVFKTLTAADVGAGTFPVGAFVFQGAVSGVAAFTMNGALTLVTDNAFDLGASGTARFRDFFLGRNAAIAGTLSVTGTISGPLVNAITFGTHLTGGSYNNSGAVSLATDAASANTVGTIVARDSSGNFSAGTITAALTGNASTASAVAASAITGTTLASNVVNSSLVSFGTLAAHVLFVDATYDIGQSGATRPRHGYFSGNVTATSFIGALSGNATTASTLATPRAINGVNFDGSIPITVTAAAATLSGTVLNATVVTSSLTAVGTITTGVWQGTAIADANLAALGASKLTGTTLAASVTASSLTSFGTLGADVLFTDGLYDIGKTGASRPRDFFTSRNASIGGTLTVIGTTTLATIGAGTWNGSAIGAVFGGTGLTAYTPGDTLYSNGTNTLARLTGNITTTKKFLSQTGDGANSTAPSWVQVAASDILAATFTGAFAFSGALTASSTFAANGAATFGGVATFNNGMALGSPLTFTIDNAYDIGANGASRPRDVFVGRNLTVTGTFTLNSGLTLAGALAGVTSLTMSGALSGGTTASFSSTLSVGGIASLLAATLTLGTDAVGTNVSATSVTVTAPRSTGSATPATLIFQITRAGGGGAGVQSWANNLTLAADALQLGQNASGLNAAATAYVISAPTSTGNATPATLTIQTGHVGGSSSSAQSLDNLVIFGDRAVTVLSTATLTLGGTSVTTTGVVATNLTGTLQTAAQPNVTSLGTLAADLLFVDATYDIGKSGATRPRDAFISRNFTAGGTATIAGAATLSSTLALAGDFTINTNKFTVTASNGNTVVGGTLSVTSTSTFSAAASFTTISATSISTSAGITVSTTLGVTGLATLSGGATVGTLLNFSADNTYDIAAAGSGRPRDVFIGRNLTVTGTSTLTGTVSLGGDLQLNNASYVKGKIAAGTATRMLGINASDVFFVGSVDAAIASMNFNGNGVGWLSLTSSTAVFNSTALSGITTLDATNDVRLGSAGGNRQLALGASAPAADNGYKILITSSNAATNWQIDSNAITGSALSFTPSTAGGGSTFTTAVLRLLAGTGTIVATGAALGGVTTLGLSGTITSTKDGQQYGRTGASTAAQYFDIANTSGRGIYGVEASAGGGLATGSSAYATLLVSYTAFPLELATNANVRLSISSAGAFDFKSNPLSGITTLATNNAITTTTSTDGNASWALIQNLTGSTNTASLQIRRGDQANGYARVYFQTGATTNWEMGLHGGDSKWRLRGNGGIDAFTITDGTGGNVVYVLTGAVSGVSTFGLTGAITSTLASGSVLVDQSGTTGAMKINFQNTSGTLILGLEASAGGTTVSGSSAYAAIFGNSANNPTELFTNNSVRLSISGGGAVTIGTMPSTQDAFIHGITTATGNKVILSHTHTDATNPFGISVEHTGADKNDTTHTFLDCYGTTTLRAQIRSNGGLANFSANNVNLSDERLKTGIVSLESQWAKHLALRVVRGKFIDQTHDDDNYMGIAQNVGTLWPELMDDTNPDRLGIYETDLNWITRGVVQEAQQRIESLEQFRARAIAKYPELAESGA